MAHTSLMIQAMQDKRNPDTSPSGDNIYNL